MTLVATLTLLTQVPDSSALRHPGQQNPPIVTAVRIMRPPILDGRLDDSVWALATPVTRFVQQDPEEGKPVSERTEVRVLYDADAIYVGARLYDREPRRIVSRLARRDAQPPSDDFRVLFDSYHDHRTAFRFTVNPAGVKGDIQFGDDGDFADDSWDPVWESATSIDSSGWSAEIRIPFSQLRFSRAREQVWGVRFVRFIQRRNEFALFPFMRRTESGLASRFAHLVGLHDIPSPRRVELLPYRVGRGTYDATATPGDPFHAGGKYFGGSGLDLKYGVTSNLTLDASVNPDFGQVEIDPAFVNLTAFEQFLPEHRPFFVEGTNIFTVGTGGGSSSGFGGTPRFFYSRRIGRPPQGSADAPANGWEEGPNGATIVGAVKLSGRTGQGWSVGVLDAVTALARATVQDSLGTRSYPAVEPLTNYFVGRFKRDWKGGTTGVGIFGTSVYRQIDTTSLDFLRTSAQVGAVDFFHRWGANNYLLQGSFGAGYVTGSRQAIRLTQRSSARYYQRPDAGHVSLDSTRTALGGFTGDLGVNRVAGKWTWTLVGSFTTPGFETNDIGFQTRVDRISAGAGLVRRWTRGSVFQNGDVHFFVSPSWNFDGNPLQRTVGVDHFGQLHNFWGYFVSFDKSWQALDDRLTRGGPLAAKPGTWSTRVEGFTDSRKWVSGDFHLSYNRDQAGGWGTNGGVGVHLRPSAAVSFDLSPGYFTGRTIAQYVQAVSDSLDVATFGRRYLFGELLERGLDVEIHANVTLSPTLSFQLYHQPFLYTGDFGGFKELATPRTFDFAVYGRDNNSTIAVAAQDAGGRPASYQVDPDGPAGPAPSFTFTNPSFRTRSFRTNAVLRWEYRTGSTLFLVWTQHRAGFVPYDPSFNLDRDFRRDLFADPPINVLLVKLNYWLSW